MNKDVKISTFGNELMMLYGRVNLSQGKFATSVGISPSALRKWESNTSSPKAESLKRVIAVLLSKGAFSQGEELAEAIHLWELVNKTGLKVPFDEVWFRGVMQDQASVGEDRIGALHRTGASPIKANLTAQDLTNVGTGASLGRDEANPSSTLWHDDASEESKSHGVDEAACPLATLAVASSTATVVSSTTKFAPMGASPIPTRSGVLAPTKMRERRKKIQFLLIALIILTIIGSAGATVFYARDLATTQANNSTTDSAYPGYLSGHGTLAFFDALSQQNGSNWSSLDGTDNSGMSCQFTGGAYHASEQLTNYSAWCYMKGRTLSHFALEVQLTITQGDCGGISFAEYFKTLDYDFDICQNGTYMIDKFVYQADSHVQTLLHSGSSSAIHAGRSQQNKVALVAYGSTITFYVNEQQIGQVQDSSDALGTIALLAAPFLSGGHATDVAYSNARLWAL